MCTYNLTQKHLSCLLGLENVLTEPLPRSKTTPSLHKDTKLSSS